MPKRLTAVLTGALLVFAAAAAAFPAGVGEPRVAVSIKPVHSLVAAVMAGAGAPYLIVGGAATPHAYVLRPSDARALAEAELVFRIGGNFERFLDKPLAALAGRARIVELLDVPLMGLLVTDPEHGGDGIDPHLWLDPRNARAIVAVAVAELSTLDPLAAGLYRDNGERLSRRLDNLYLELELKLGPVAAVPFIVYHDAFRYLTETFSLNQVGIVALTPERPPGTRHVREIRDQMRQLDARCLFREPQFASRLMATLAEGSVINVGFLDPLGAALEPGPELYFDLMRTNAAALAGCLG